ncbi:MAG: CARDB domain-containing protein, partial [Flammeovirgaceae bacterium]
PFANSPKTKTEVEDFLSTIRLSGVSRSGAEILKRHVGNSTLFWISDFQSSTLGTLPKIDSTTHLRLVPVSTENTSNVFVDSIRLENPFMIGGEKNTLHVQLRNSGDKSIEGLVVKLSINGQQVSASTIHLEPQSTSEVLFDLSGSKAGQNRGVISFSDFPISFDNEFYFTLNYSGKLRVREIKQTTEKTYVEKVFANKDVFDFISLEAKNLNYSLLQPADLVVVNGLDQINPSLAAALATY